MFYADFVLSKKGPLARIWLAAHWDKKLTKTQIFETNIESSIERILKPKVKLALRTSGHLMLGVVRIYSRKTKYLLADCNEAFVKIKMAFRPGMVDLPEDHREAAVNAVTLPEVFHDFDSVMPDLNNVDIEAQFTLNQSRADEITMREDYGNVPSLAVDDGGFGGDGFGAGDVDITRRSVSLESSLHQMNVIFGEGIDALGKHDDRPSTSDNLAHLSTDIDLPKDGFGHLGGGDFEGGLFEDAPMGEPVIDTSLQFHESIQHDGAVPCTSKKMTPDVSRLEGVIGALNADDDFDDDHFIPPSPGGLSSDGSRPPSPNALPSAVGTVAVSAIAVDQFLPPNDLNEQSVAPNDLKPGVTEHIDGADGNENQPVDQTTLLQNEEESFALAPVDASALRGLPKTKRKRKLIVDEVKNISGDEMKAQLSDTSDIVITLDLAPPTKRLMHWKETGGVEKLFALPGKNIPSSALFKNYQRHLTSKAAPNEDNEEPDNLETHRDGIDEGPNAAVGSATTPRRGRKRKMTVIEEEVEPVTEQPVVEPPLEPLPSIDQNQELFNYNNDLEQNVGTPILNAADIIDNEASHVAQSLNITGAVHMELDQMAPPTTPTLTPENIVPSCNPELDFPTQDQALFNFSDALNHNPMALGLNVTGGLTPAHNKMDFPDQNQSLFNFNDDIEHNAVISGLNAGGGMTPWHDADYDNPASVEPQEERGDNETIEQFEERILNKRAGHLYSTIRMRISMGASTYFNDLIIGNQRKQVAQKFYSLLVLKKHRILELTQNEPYGTIALSKGSNFDDPKL